MSAGGNPAPSSQRKNPSPSGEFTLRLVSALMLAAIAIFLTWAGPWPFAGLVGLCVAVLAWEWTGLAASRGARTDAGAIAIVVIAAIISAGMGHIGIAGAIIFGGAIAALALTQRKWTAIGIFYIGLPAVAVVMIRADAAYGLSAVTFLLLVVWCSDIMAYVTGRLAGGPKLAPAISPSKTWSGSIAGLVFPALLAFLYAGWMGATSAVILALTGASLALAAQAGDLIESAIKRSSGVKDSSRLIPGHGGLLDRLDGFIFAAAGAGLLALLRNTDAPGMALLIWP